MSTTLLDLSDDLLHQIVLYLLSPVQVAHHQRVSTRALARALPLAQTCTRLFIIVTGSLTDVEPWPSARLGDYGLRFFASYSGTSLRRLVLRGCSKLSADALCHLARHCTQLRTLDVSHIGTVNNDVITAICLGVGKSLESLLIRRCVKVTDVSLKTIADKCPSLSALDAAALTQITDHGVQHLAHVRRSTLRILILSWCKRVTDASLEALAKTQIRALFLRGLLISDDGVAELVNGLGNTLVTVDLLDCPNVTNRVFSILRDGCAAMKDKLRTAERRDLFQNALSILDGYVHVVSGVDEMGQQSTLVCVVDAGLANAFAFRVLSGESVCFERDEVRVIASNSGLFVTRETRRFVQDSFGIEV